MDPPAAGYRKAGEARHAANRCQATRGRQARALLVLTAFLALLPADLIAGQSWIPDNFPLLDWQPTIAPFAARYVGNAACAQCHTAEAASYSATPMAHALELPGEARVLRAHPLLTFRNSRYVYEVVTTTAGRDYIVNEGPRSIAIPIRWALGYGIGEVGQTYVFQYQGHFYESQVSYYAGVGGLDITMGHILKPPAFLEAALGYRLDKPSVMECLRCHATAATNANDLQLDQMIPGIGCEGCHGPGGDHIAAIQAGTIQDLHIFNPGRLSPGRITDFCGACHRTTTQEKILKVRGVENARFQGYRLARSRCYDPADSRISCTACHNPHQPLERNESYYDGKCLACHHAGSATAHDCPTGKPYCVTCHMPKVPVLGVHTMFTDHWIRIAKPGGTYPD